MRYITHSKYRNWSECDVRRILNCDIYDNISHLFSQCDVRRIGLWGVGVEMGGIPKKARCN